MQTLSWSYCTTPSAQLSLCGKAPSGYSKGELNLFYVDSHRVLEAGSAALDTFARINRGLQPTCNSGPSFPQRPFSPDSSKSSAEHLGRQNVASRAGKSNGVDNLCSSSKQKTTAKSPAISPQAASSVLRSTFPATEGAIIPISLSPSHGSSSIFLPPNPVNFPFPERLRLEGDTISTSSVFRMALTCCVVAQWIKIAGALSMWTSRLRLKFFESPLVYKNSTKSSKLGRSGVFWDLENCPVPSGCDIPTVIDKVRAIGNSFGEIQCFRAYGKLEQLSRQALPFLNKDVELCPVPDGKESADKAIILDASLFALDHRPCPEDSEDSAGESDAVVVVTGDRGFAALLKELSRRRVTTIVVGNAHQPLPYVLSQSADYSFGWEDMMVNEDIENGLIYKASKSASCSCSGTLESVERALLRRICYGEDTAAENGRIELQDSSDLACCQLDSTGSELLCTTSSEQPNLSMPELPKFLLDGSTEESRAEKMARKQQLQGAACNSCELANLNKISVPIGGKIKVLRHLRCEVAAIAVKYCNNGQSVELEKFLRLFEQEMGHALVPSYYGFGSLKVLLQSMPDLISLRPSFSDNSTVEVFPFYPKGKTCYGKINYSREDLRCILYELLRTMWPCGVNKEKLSSEHLSLTGRPLVLVTYEFLKNGDVFGSMRDILYLDPRTKQLYLVDGAQEPAGYSALAQNDWN